jgi:hypothetical protein
LAEPKKLDTAELGPIKIEPVRPKTRVELLEYVNQLNIKAHGKGIRDKFWTVTILYNTVIYRQIGNFEPTMFEVHSGVFK